MKCLIRDCAEPKETGWLFCAHHLDAYKLRGARDDGEPLDAIRGDILDAAFEAGYETGYDDGCERSYRPNAARRQYADDRGRATAPGHTPREEARRLLRFAMTAIEHKLAGPVAQWFDDTKAWLARHGGDA